MIPDNLPGAVTFPCRPDGMGVVEPQYPPIIPVVQGQRISDAMRGLLIGIHQVRLELCPIAVIHREDFTVQIQQSDKCFIFPGI